DLFPGSTTVDGTEDPTLVVGSVGMPHPRDEHDVRISRMDDDAADLLDVSETDVLPGAPAVDRLEDPVADAEVGPVQSLAAADVDDVRVRGGNRDVADRSGRRLIEDRPPCAAVVIRFPDSTVVHAHEEHTGLRRHADAADGTTRPERADQSITK